MKRILFFIFSLLTVAALATACGNSDNPDDSNGTLGGNNEKTDADSVKTTKDLVVYFSATGNTKAVAEEIARQTGADIMPIEPAEPYAANPYDDSDRIQDESYNDKRPGVTNLPSAETMEQYDRIFVGSPIWWHQPAMVVCTFLEAFDLKDKTVIPFFTYGSTTYLNEAMHKIYKSTPNSTHIPATLPEDLNPDDITVPGPADDSGIDMPGNTRGVKAWLERLGLI